MSVTLERPTGSSAAWEENAGYLLDPATSDPSTHSRGMPVGQHAVNAEGAHREIIGMIREQSISLSCGARAIRTLHRLMSPSTPKPHIRAVDHEVTVLWLSGKMSLELSIPDPGEEIYVRRTDDLGAERELGFYTSIPETARNFLNRFA